MIVAMARRRGSQGDGRTALALASEALRLSPGSVPALVEKARALETLGRRSEARRAWQLVLELDQGNGSAARFLEETAPRPGSSPATPISLHLDVQGSAR
jgi:Flp pilus assembly protein TadD